MRPSVLSVWGCRAELSSLGLSALAAVFHSEVTSPCTCASSLRYLACAFGLSATGAVLCPCDLIQGPPICFPIGISLRWVRWAQCRMSIISFGYANAGWGAAVVEPCSIEPRLVCWLSLLCFNGLVLLFVLRVFVASRHM